MDNRPINRQWKQGLIDVVKKRRNFPFDMAGLTAMSQHSAIGNISACGHLFSKQTKMVPNDASEQIVAISHMGLSRAGQ